MTSAGTHSLPNFNVKSPQHLLAYGFGAGLSPWAATAPAT